MPHLLSIISFILPGPCEISGSYLIWLWLREGRSLGYGALGAGILILYGVIPTLPPAHFGRVYAAYVCSSRFRGGDHHVLAMLNALTG